MRTLRPDSNGVINPSRRKIVVNSQLQEYTKPDSTLVRIDKLKAGGSPDICVTRKRGGIGDVLMTLPAVRSISKKYGVKVDYGTDFEYLDGALEKVLRYNPYIRNVLKWDRIDKSDYDAIIDFTCPCIAHEQPGASPIHRIDLFARHARIPLDSPDIDFTVTPEERIWATNYILQNNLEHFDLLLIQPFSSATNRNIPAAKLKHALASILKSRKKLRGIVITNNSDMVRENWNFSNIHVLNNFDIRQIAAIMTQCKLVLCQDSSVLHIASALHFPTVALFGPTDPRARVNYHPEAVAIWPGVELANYPIWYADVPNKDLCWKRLEERDIINTVISMLDKRPLPMSNHLIHFGSKEKQNKLYEVI